MKKKLVVGLGLLLLTGSLVACQGGATEDNASTVVQEQEQESTMALENPAGIVLQHPNATKADAAIYQLGNHVIMFKMDVNNLTYKNDDFIGPVFCVPDESTYIRFNQDEYVSCFYNGKTSFCVRKSDGERVEGQERIAFEGNVFYVITKQLTEAYVESATGEYLQLCSVFDGSSSANDDYIKEFKAELKDTLKHIEIFLDTDINNTEATSVEGNKFDLTKYPVMNDLFALKLYDTFGFNLYDSNNLLSYLSEDEGMIVKLDNNDVNVEFGRVNNGEDAFTAETDKVNIRVRQTDGNIENVSFMTKADEFFDWGISDFGATNIAESEENMRAFITKYFGEVK